MSTWCHFWLLVIPHSLDQTLENVPYKGPESNCVRLGLNVGHTGSVVAAQHFPRRTKAATDST